jgi:hypothetical protein
VSECGVGVRIKTWWLWPSVELTVTSSAMKAGVDTVGGVSLPPAPIVKIDGTRTLVAPDVAAAPVVFGGEFVVAVCEGPVVVVAVAVADELVAVACVTLDVVVLECFDPPHPPRIRKAGKRTDSARKRLIL